MADGKVTIAVDLDGKKAQGDINSLRSSLSGLGSSFKSVLGANLVGGALMSGISALTGGVKGAFSSAMQEGAKLQQSIGGIETLFKESAGKVKQYASDSFRTAGISANEYMENVTSFSASLISSLGGDTAAAADLANTALMDMSDNANKMGSDMSMITQTYQSLARGNYQMLDNLKLGYGGTKAELQRLIKDSASYKDIQEELNMTVEEGDLSFANIVKAISVMQKKLGITGTTAKEASETFSGSFASMRSAFQDFLGNLTTGGDIKKPLKNLAKTASTFIVGNFIPMVANAFKALPGAIGTFIAEAKPELKKRLKELFPNLDLSVFDKVLSVFSKFSSLIGFAIEDAKEAIDGFIAGFNSSGAWDAILSALDAIGLAFLDISEKFSGTIDWEGIGTSVGNIAKFLADAAKSGAEFVQSLPPGTLQAIAGGVLAAVTAFKGFQTVSGIIKGVSSSFGLLKAALTNPFGMAIVGIGLLVAGFIKLYTSNEKFRNAVDKTVATVKKFISNLDPERMKSWVATIAAVAGGFGIFKMLNGWNPFKAFGKGGKEALDGVKDALSGTSGQATQSKGIIEQVFSGLGTLITSIAKGISIVLQGLATALSTVAQGFGQAAAMASPAQWLSMGAAMLMVGAGVALASAGIYILVQAAIQLSSAGSGAAIALAGLALGIAALAGIFALLGPALSAGAIGILAFGAAIALIGVGVYAASAGLSMLAGHLPTIATYGASAAVGIAALGAGLLVMGAGALVAGAGLLVASAGVIAFGSGMLIAAVGVAAFGLALNVCQPGITAFANAITKVVNAISGGLVAILNSISGVIQSVGQAALNAGKGFNQLATGVVKITNTNLGDMAASLGAVAVGVGAIASHSGSMASIGQGMKTLGQGLVLVQASGTGAVTILQSLASTLPAISSSLIGLAPTLTTVATALSTFATSSISSMTSLTMISSVLLSFNASLTAVHASITTIGGAMIALGSNMSTLYIAFLNLSTSILQASTSVYNLQTAMYQTASAVISISQGFSTLQVVAGASMASLVIAVVQSMSQSVSATRSGMSQMVAVVRSSASQMTQAGQQAGRGVSNGVTSGIRSGIGSATVAMSAMMSAVRSAGMAGVGSMRNIGSMIGQGLAQGMYSALGAVTVAANALVAQAERAARAKAQIHSPSRLFRDSVGRFLPMGVAVGIEKNTKYVDKAMDGMYDRINAFSFKAEDVIGVGKSKLSKVVQVKSELEQAVKAKVDVAKDKANNLVEKALEIAEKAVERPAEMRFDDGTLVAKTGDKFARFQSEQARRENRMRGILT